MYFFCLTASFGLFGSVFAYTIDILQNDIQEKVSAIMPFTHKKHLVIGTLSNPLVELKGDTNQVCVLADISIAVARDLRATGNGKVCGILTYRTEESSFFLTDVHVTDLIVNRLPRAYLPVAQEIVTVAAIKAFTNLPLYTFKDSLKHRLAKSLFKSIEVKTDKLVLTFELF